MNINDEQLQQLIDKICGSLDRESSEWRKAISRLIFELQQLPGLLKSSHPLYLEALDKTWEWVSNNICKFKPKPYIPVSKSLVTWINGHLSWRIKDLYRNQQRQSNHEESVYVVINQDSENPLMLIDQLSETGFNPPKLTGLDAYLEEQRKKSILTIWQKFELYVQEDPEKLLCKCHPKKYRDCNCQLLSKKRLFTEPPEKFRHISKELGINEQTLISHWKKKCLPLLQKILEDLGYSKNGEL